MAVSPKTYSDLADVFGILGNIVSFMVFMAPLPTFIRIYRKKSTEGFQAIPYSVSLFSAMLYLYYAYIKGNMVIVVSINSAGVIIQGAYLVVFMIYATRDAKLFTTKLLIGFNLVAYGAIVVSTYTFFHAKLRITIVGWMCSIFSVCVFAAPLSIMMKVIRTKSAEFMPFWLSFCLTWCAVMWFFYGFLIRDYYVAAPNILGFAFGIAQMILFGIYRDTKKVLPRDDFKEIEAAEMGKIGEDGNLKGMESGKTVKNGEEAKVVIQIEQHCDACVI